MPLYRSNPSVFDALTAEERTQIIEAHLVDFKHIYVSHLYGLLCGQFTKPRSDVHVGAVTIGVRFYEGSGVQISFASFVPDEYRNLEQRSLAFNGEVSDEAGHSFEVYKIACGIEDARGMYYDVVSNWSTAAIE